MNLTDKELLRIQETLEMIPPDVVSLLEVGCGDGRVTNSICPKRKVVSIDIDKKSFNLFEGIKIIADVSRLPFKDLRFDLVLCAEILEHLPENVFYQALYEIN
jgi:2-polyprenyl-3-methyl-5-hydroxy-6-metoxy-1,4-benzoquinol methylase